jgi:hypothetical protein
MAKMSAVWQRKKAKIMNPRSPAAVHNEVEGQPEDKGKDDEDYNANPPDISPEAFEATANENEIEKRDKLPAAVAVPADVRSQQHSQLVNKQQHQYSDTSFGFDVEMSEGDGGASNNRHDHQPHGRENVFKDPNRFVSEIFHWFA